MSAAVSQDQDLRSLPYIPPMEEHEERRLMRHSPPFAISSSAKSDPIKAVRLPAAPEAMPTPIASFDGMSATQSGCGCTPPDTDGDVGPNHYIQSVNSSIKIFDKSGNPLNGVNGTTYNSFFSAIGASNPCGNGLNEGDGIVFYDQIADRWVVSDFAFATNNSGNYQCIGVSKTNDPVAGGWWLYFLQTDPSNPTWFGDYPKFGLWPDAYYLSVNLFIQDPNPNNSTFEGVRVYAFNRAAMLNGTGAPNPGVVAFTITAATLGDAYSLQPATFRAGSAPPAGTPEYFLAINSPSASGVTQTQVFAWKFHVDFATPANSTLGLGATHTPNGTITVNSFVDAFTSDTLIVPQNGGAQPLDTLGDKIMTPLVYQNRAGTESLWAAHTINDSQPTAIRWYQFNVTGGTIASTPVQQQTFNNGNDGLWRFMPSIAVDSAGNMAINYSVSSSSTNPAIKYAGRLAGDPLNTLAQGEALLIQGGGVQTDTGGRWGDYSALSVDPSDNTTFWATNEYYSTTSSGNWNTRIGKFKFISTAQPVADTVTLAAENFSPPNNAPDPGETVTVNLAVKNTGVVNTSNLVGTLQATGGVTSPSGPQTYGVVVAGGSSVIKPFTFTASGACGSLITLTLSLQDGATNYGTVTYTLRMGVTGANVNIDTQNFDSVAAPALPSGWTSAHTVGAVNFVTSATTPDTAPNDAFAPDNTAAGTVDLVSLTLQPATKVTFRNFYNLEVDTATLGFDGMVLEISFDGGTNFSDILSAGGSFAAGGYNRTIESGSNNPLAGRQAWSGLSAGTTGAPAYITTTVNLPAQAASQTFKLRWRVATDASLAAAGASGVRIDSIATSAPQYACNAVSAPSISNGPPPSPVIVGTPYSFTFIATGNPPPTFTLSGNAPPPGIGLSSAGVLSGTATSGGTGTFPGITVTASNGNAPNASQTFALSTATRANNYIASFGLTGGNAVLTFDYDGDSLANLMEYALGLNPTAAGLSGLPIVTVKDYGGTKYLSMTFVRSSLATDLTYIVQGSADLTNWSDLGTSPGGAATTGLGFVSETGSAPSFTVEVRDTVPFTPNPATKRFLRLKVTSP